MPLVEMVRRSHRWCDACKGIADGKLQERPPGLRGAARYLRVSEEARSRGRVSEQARSQGEIPGLTWRK